MAKWQLTVRVAAAGVLALAVGAQGQPAGRAPATGQAPPTVEPPPPGAVPDKSWAGGLFADPNFYPLAVWLQPARSAKRYKEAGVNLFVGQWKGPTEEQLAALREAGMPLICEFNDVAVRHLKDPLIVGWLQVDEPDIAHAHLWEDLRARAKPSETFGALQPPYHPSEIIAQYKLLKAMDPTRPVFTSFSFAVIYGDYAARGNRKNHPEDFGEYLQGLDIAAFDIYPGIHQYPPAAAKYWTVAWGVRKLLELGKGQKVIWVDIEAMAPRLDHSPQTMKAEVWMSIIHGAQGITYYVHQNASGRLPIPSVEDSVFLDANMLKVFTETNKLVASLAPVINSPAVADGVKVSSSVPAGAEMAAAGLAPIAATVRRHGGSLYLFSVRMENRPAAGTFQLQGLSGSVQAEAIGEGRKVQITDGQFSDQFEGMGVHLYKVPAGG